MLFVIAQFNVINLGLLISISITLYYQFNVMITLTDGHTGLVKMGPRAFDNNNQLITSTDFLL